MAICLQEVLTSTEVFIIYAIYPALGNLFFCLTIQIVSFTAPISN